jgi:hypothetical protein
VYKGQPAGRGWREAPGKGRNGLEYVPSSGASPHLLRWEKHMGFVGANANWDSGHRDSEAKEFLRYSG